MGTAAGRLVTMSSPRSRPTDPAAGVATDVVESAQRSAAAAAHRAGIIVRAVHEMDDLRAVSRLLASVWGPTPEGVPVHSEVMRSLEHAGGCTTAAFDADGVLVGGAVLSPSAGPGATYSLIAAAAPGRTGHGIGYAVKLAQRAWALERGRPVMVWTFDPLVGRNARFNLAKLGAHAADYEVSFYGRMHDSLNGDDDADRLAVTWVMDSARAVSAAEGTATEPPGPADDAEQVSDGPDGAPMVRRDAAGSWIRVPRDIVALRREQPDLARQWRQAAREAFVASFADGLVATHVTRQGHYLLTPGGAP